MEVLKLEKGMQQQFNYIYLVCDTYNDGSIKAGERNATAIQLYILSV